MRDRRFAGLGRMLELHVAALLGDAVPALRSILLITVPLSTAAPYRIPESIDFFSISMEEGGKM
jgi:hypothetical protein